MRGGVGFDLGLNTDGVPDDRAAERAALPGRIGALACRYDPAGVLVLPDHDAIVVADLHLEKGSSLARRGQMLPPYDTRETLARLAAVIGRLSPRRVIALGDSFHDVDGPQRMGGEEAALLAALGRRAEFVWITGNHDPRLPESLGGICLPSLTLDGVVLRHEPSSGRIASGGGEIAGHLHPVARVAGRGGHVRRRCFGADGRRCILPAFGAYAGGLNLRDKAFAALFAEALTAFVLGDSRVYAIPPAQLRPDPGALTPFTRWRRQG